MGTPEFSVPSLERLSSEGYRLIAVVTGPDRRRGRGKKWSPTPVKMAAQRLGIETILQPESVKDPAFAEAVAGLSADLIIVVAYQILPPTVFTAARLGAFNLHGSLLPRYRGAAPINRAVMAGESETGVTTFFLKEKVDTGNIILRASLPIGPEETAGEVHDRMMMLGADVVVETVRLIESGQAQPRAQDDMLATPAPKIFKEMCQIPWDRNALEVHNHIRGLSPFPGAWTMLGDMLLKLYRSRLVDGTGTPGTVLRADNHLIVACGSGAVEVLELQQQSRRRLDAHAFLKGTLLEPGSRFGAEGDT